MTETWLEKFLLDTIHLGECQHPKHPSILLPPPLHWYYSVSGLSRLSSPPPTNRLTSYLPLPPFLSLVMSLQFCTVSKEWNFPPTPQPGRLIAMWVLLSCLPTQHHLPSGSPLLVPFAFTGLPPPPLQELRVTCHVVIQYLTCACMSSVLQFLNHPQVSKMVPLAILPPLPTTHAFLSLAFDA